MKFLSPWPFQEGFSRDERERSYDEKLGILMITCARVALTKCPSYKGKKKNNLTISP